MARFPDVGKYLWAMSREAFNPKSEGFDLSWKSQEVDEFETRRLVQAALRDTAAEFGVENECRFLRVFGHLTLLGEPWNFLNLEFLQRRDDPGMKRFKHEMSAHWVQLAARLATKPIPLQPGPVALLIKDDRGIANGVRVAGDTPPFSDGTTSSLEFNDVNLRKPIRWREFCHTIISLEFEKQVQSKAWALTEAEPEKYQQLTRSEISRLWQVQLQLSCGCGIVEVEGAIDPVDVEILATLLGHQLTELPLVELNDFEVQSKKVAESLKASHEILILLVTKTERLHQPVKKQCLNLQRQFPRQLRIILSSA